MRVLHIAYQQLRRYGQTRVSWAQKLSFGLIKNDHYLQTFSDRDIAAFEAPLGIRDLGVGKIHLMGAPIKYNALSGFDLELLEFVGPDGSIVPA